MAQGKFTAADVGAPKLAGSAAAVDGGWNVTAGGADIWENADQFHFVFEDVDGDFDIAVRVESFTPAHLYSKTGLMIRESLSGDSAHVLFLTFSNNEPRNNNLGAYEMQFRARAGENCQAIYPAVRPPAAPEFPAAFPNAWLRVARRGDRFSAYGSTDGRAWKLYGEAVVALAKSLKAGPALTSHNEDATATAAFRDYQRVTSDMDTKPIIMTVGFQARPGKEAELRAALTEVLAPTRQEDGCLFYDLHVATDDPSKFLFHESWASQAHHQAHDRTPHIQQLRSRIAELSLPAAKAWWEKIG